MKYKIILALAIITTISASAYAIVQNIKPEAASTGVCPALVQNTPCISSVTPEEGPTSGGTNLIINGENFPYGPTDAYVQTGLVAHFDGINNVGYGDTNHSTDTTTWKNLKGNTDLHLIANELPATSATGWQDVGYKFNDAFNTTADIWASDSLKNSNFPLNAAPRTIEVIYRNPNTASINANKNVGMVIDSIDMGVSTQSTTFTNYVQFNNPNFYAFTGFGASWDYMISNASNKKTELSTPDKLYTLTAAYSGSFSSADTKAFVNGAAYSNVLSANGTLATCIVANEVSENCRLQLGRRFLANDTHAAGFTIMAYRLYDHVLSQDEITKNADVDAKRYVSPPAVTVGGQECKYAIVISTTKIQCMLPAVSTEQTVDVELTIGTNVMRLQNAYSYKNPAVTSISPTSGPVSGGTEIIINGTNFPYAPTSNYAQDHLVAHYDGIDNLGLGDPQHSNNTTVWRNLVGPEDLTLKINQSPAADQGGWTSKGYKFNSLFNNNDMDYWDSPTLLNSNFPLNNQDRTIEVLYINLNEARVTEWNTIPFVMDSIDYGTNSQGSAFGHYHTYSGRFYALGGIGSVNDYRISSESGNIKPELFIPNKIITATSTYSTSIRNPATKGFANSIYYPNIEVAASDGQLHTCIPLGGSELNANCRLHLGQRFYLGNTHAGEHQILAYRLYDKVLSQQEIDQNYSVDQKRFLDLPVVTIGGVACTDVQIISSKKMSCKTGAHAAAADQDVNVTFGSHANIIQNGYSYVTDSVPYVTAYSPKSGPAFIGTTDTGGGADYNALTINGNFPGEQANYTINIGANQCNISNFSASQIKCAIPPVSGWGSSVSATDIASATFKDITIKKSGSDPILLMSGYEYLKTSKNPISYRVQTDEDGFVFVGGDSSEGVVIEESWVGISKVSVTVPTALASNFVVTSDSNSPFANWTQSSGATAGKSGYTTFSYAPTSALLLKKPHETENLLNALKFTGSLDAVDNPSASISLTNGLW